MVILLREFASPDEEMKKIVLKVRATDQEEHSLVIANDSDCRRCHPLVHQPYSPVAGGKAVRCDRRRASRVRAGRNLA